MFKKRWAVLYRFSDTPTAMFWTRRGAERARDILLDARAESESEETLPVPAYYVARLIDLTDIDLPPDPALYKRA